MLARPEPLRRAIADAIPERPFDLRWWDGADLPATAPSANGNGSRPVFTVRSPEAVAHALRAPGQLGIGRAYVSGALEVDDVDAALALLDGWSPPPLDTRAKLRLMAGAAQAAGVTKPPRAPQSELRPTGRRHSVERDRRSVRHHYDVSNDFFALFLDESMTYSCAFFSRAAQGATLEEAQQAKLAVTAGKLELEPGQRVLDVGCGWGSFTRHVAREHGVTVVGVTLSERQAELAGRRAQEEGVGDRIDIRLMDWRELTGERFDAIASIGMVEHVGSANIDAYAARLGDLLVPGGRLLNHGIGRLRHTDAEAGPFSERFVFPDAAPLHLSRITFAIERAGLEPEHAEGFRNDYAETLRHWAHRLDEHHDEALRLAGAERLRVWRLYLRAARRGFESGFTSIFQVKARKPA